MDSNSPVLRKMKEREDGVRPEASRDGMLRVLAWYDDSSVSSTASLVLRARPDENAIFASTVSVSWRCASSGFGAAGS
jgi:hypothetical protein